MRRGACLILVLVAAAASAVSARAGATTTSTTTATTTSTTTASPAVGELVPGTLPAGCLGAGGVLVEEPGQVPIALDTPASALGASGYPGDSSVVSFASATGHGSPCRTGTVSLQSLSLFGGAVTATSLTATGGRGSVSGLAVNGAPVSVTAGKPLDVGGSVRLRMDEVNGRLSAVLAVRLLRASGPVPAGTLVLVGVAVQAPATVAKHATESKTAAAQKPATAAQATAARAKKARRKKHVPQPLKVTPKLGRIHYVFPVDGGASYVDTYGANRSDIYDGWHHGDDLFAPLGTPVVAVARGTLSLVGWNELGGWRLWLTDKDGNSFYYAHLSGYSRWILRHRHVKAGQVIGFLGRTGDAFTTEPHLHFEIHPHQLLKLGYDGAVDPTTYLRGWKVVHVPADELPRPARLQAPAGAPAQEASVVWHELLVARHLLPAATARTPDDVGRGLAAPPRPPAGAEPVSARVAAPPAVGLWPTAATAAVLLLGAFAIFAVGRRRRWALPVTPFRPGGLARAARRARAPRWARRPGRPSWSRLR